MMKPRKMVCRACKSETCEAFHNRYRVLTALPQDRDAVELSLYRVLETLRRTGGCQG